MELLGNCLKSNFHPLKMELEKISVQNLLDSCTTNPDWPQYTENGKGNYVFKVTRNDENRSSLLSDLPSNDSMSSQYTIINKAKKQNIRPKTTITRNMRKTEFIFISPVPQAPLTIFLDKVFNICCLACDVLLVSNFIGESNMQMRGKQLEHIWKHFKTRERRKVDVIEPDW